MKNAIDFLNQTIKKDSTIVIGVSGGADSMCLFHLINEIKKEKNLTIICAHINHGVREESKEEEIFVNNICKKYKNTFESIKLNFENTKNFEKNARNERYNFYNELIKKYQANYLMTAHHGDDLVETILMRLTRGSTLEGYSGFGKITKKENYDLVRPFIHTTKEEIENYNRENNIEYRIDKTNKEEHYTRNRYRMNVLPFLKKENKNVHKKYLKFSEELKEVEEYLQKQTDIALTRSFDFDKVNLREFKKLDVVLQKRVIKSFLKKEYENDCNVLNDRHLELILKICHSKRANLEVNLPLKRILIKEYDKLYFGHNSKKECQEYILEENVKWNERETILKLTEDTKEKSNFLLRLDSGEVALPLKIRTRHAGDTMQVKNLNGTKKVKDIFIDEKIPKEKRSTWPVVVDTNDTILWLPGLKKTNFDKKNNEYYDIIYKYVISEEKQNEEK